MYLECSKTMHHVLSSGDDICICQKINGIAIDIHFVYFDQRKKMNHICENIYMKMITKCNEFHMKWKHERTESQQIENNTKQ